MEDLLNSFIDVLIIILIKALLSILLSKYFDNNIIRKGNICDEHVYFK